MKSFKLGAAVIITLALIGLPVFGSPITVSFDSPVQSGSAGATLGFSGTLMNTTGSTLFLNGDSLTVNSPIVLNDTPFFLNFPVSLGAGQSFSGLIFNATIPLNTALGDYLGSFSVLGGITPSASDTLGAAPFTVSVTTPAVPDGGSTAVLLATSALGLIGIRQLAKA
jgi:hypothetical protein